MDQDDNTPRTLAPVLDWRRVLMDGTDCTTCITVGLALSTYMNASGGSAFPSVATLAEDTSLTDRAVRKHLNEHLAGTFLVLVEQGGKKGEERRANEWRATFPDLVDNSLTTPERGSGVGPDPGTSTRAPRNHVPQTPERGSPQVVHRSSPENGQQPKFSPGSGQIGEHQCDTCQGTRWVEPDIGDGVMPCPDCAKASA